MTTLQFYNNIEELDTHLFNFSYKLTANLDDAKDLLQETKYKAIKYKNKYSLNTNFKAWLFTIMKNTFINNYKKAKKTLNVFEDKELDYLKISDESNTAYSYINHKELMSIVNQLDDIYKTPFIKFVDGFKYDEIADELNIPIGTVKSRIFLARKKLQEVLSNN